LDAQARNVLSGVGGMIVQPDFLDHWKFQLLVRRTSDGASPLMILRLWFHCQRVRKTRLRITPEGLACVCEWNGKPEDLISLLLELRFLEQDGEYFIVHDFAEYNGKLVSNWKNGIKGGRPRTSVKTSKPKSKLGFRDGNPPKPIPSNLSNLSVLVPEGVRGRWSEWIEYRMKNKKPPKDPASMFKKSAAWLSRFSEKDQVEIIDQSIRNDWQGLFEIKGRKPPPPPTEKESRLERERHEMEKRLYGSNND
jgi:hypothetical protein